MDGGDELGAFGADRPDLTDGTVARAARTAAQRFAGTDAVIDGALRWTYADLWVQIRRAGRATIAAGVEPGDRVAIWAPNTHEWIVAALGAHAAGAVVVPLNTRYRGSEAADIVARSGAALLLCANGFLGADYVSSLRQAPAAGDMTLRAPIVVLGADAYSAPGTVTFDAFVEAGNDVPEDALDRRIDDASPEDLSDLIFTSGTTGRPKGVMVTNAQTLRVFAQWSSSVGLRHGDRYLVVNPFFHTFGYKAGIIASILRGATIVPLAVFDVDRVLQIVEDEHISVLPGPPTLYQSILHHPNRDRFDLSALRLAVTGAAPVPVELIRRMRTELTFRTIVTGYGLTESTGVVSMCRADDPPERISASSGRAIDDTEMRVVDADGRQLPAGSAGEIVTRGYHVMKGYFEDPEATAEAIDAHGWLHTGDVGTIDADGYVTVTDRLKDMFIVGGFNAYPAEIENTLSRHPRVAQAAVVGVPDERLGEVGHAFVVARPGAEIDPDEIVSWCREEMANFKVPRRVHVIDAMPLNASGKVLKYVLRERAGI